MASLLFPKLKILPYSPQTLWKPYYLFTKLKMSKFKGKYLPYSPSQHITNVSTETLPAGEPNSPMSNNSLVFNGKDWEMPIDEENLDLENFHPRNCSSPPPFGKYINSLNNFKYN